jgi:hypothetical protein
MNQKQKAPKQPQDPYARRAKTLASSVQRLRGWVGSDPSRTPELADALVELTGHRLRGHGYALAAADAQESVRLAAQLLTANGPIGPYTSAGDAARYVAAVVQLATIQAAVGQPAAAGRTIDSLQDLHEQLGELGLEQPPQPQEAIWALSATARAALAAGDVAEANGHADAALAWLPEPAQGDDPDLGYVAMDVALLAGDCRWAAGRADEALTFLHLARDRYEAVVAGRLDEPGRLSPALLERLAEPLFGLNRDLADRLADSGEVDLGLVTRRALVERLRALAPRLGNRARLQLAAALADLADDLLAANRLDEAGSAAAEAVGMGLDWSGAELLRSVVQTTRARVLTATGQAAEAVTLLRPLQATAPAASPSADQALILMALAEALRADGDVDGAAAAEQSFGQLAPELLAPLAPVDAGRAVRDLARGVVVRGRETVSWSPLPATARYAPERWSATSPPADARAQETEWRRGTTAWLETERADAHRLELERLERARAEAERREAERAEAVRAAAARMAAERAAAEQAQLLEAERRAAAEEAERLERKRRREERLEAHRLEVERREAERRSAELEAARREEDVPVADRAEAERLELERLELERLQAELDELERAEQVAADADRVEDDRAPVQPPTPEAVAPPDTAPSVTEVEPSPAEAPPVEQVPLPSGEPVVAPPEPEHEQPEFVTQDFTTADGPSTPSESPLEGGEDRGEEASEQDAVALARAAWQDALGRGDRRGARAANEQLVELLRPRAAADPAGYGSSLREALESLAGARLRGGDLWGSRAAAREAKALGKNLSR